MIINNVKWKIKFVEPNNPNLRRCNGILTIGCTDGISKTIFINNNLSDFMTTKVLTHEIVHAVCFSYGILLDAQTEELIADFMANYGFEVVNLVEDWLNRNSICC